MLEDREQDNDDNDDDHDHAIVFHLLDDICNDSEIYYKLNVRLQLLRLSLSDDGINYVGIKEDATGSLVSNLVQAV